MSSKNTRFAISQYRGLEKARVPEEMPGIKSRCCVEFTGKRVIARRYSCLSCIGQTRNIQRFLDTHPSARAKKKFNNKAHDVLYHNLYCKSYDEYWLKTHGLWPLDCKTFLEEEFNADLTI